MAHLIPASSRTTLYQPHPLPPEIKPVFFRINVLSLDILKSLHYDQTFQSFLAAFSKVPLPPPILVRLFNRFEIEGGSSQISQITPAIQLFEFPESKALFIHIVLNKISKNIRKAFIFEIKNLISKMLPWETEKDILEAVDVIAKVPDSEKPRFCAQIGLLTQQFPQFTRDWIHILSKIEEKDRDLLIVFANSCSLEDHHPNFCALDALLKIQETENALKILGIALKIVYGTPYKKFITGIIQGLENIPLEKEEEIEELIEQVRSLFPKLFPTDDGKNLELAIQLLIKTPKNNRTQIRNILKMFHNENQLLEK